MSDSFRSHGLQHTRLPCPLPSPGACSNSCPASWWCYLSISSSAVHFSSCLQSSPAPESFLISQFFPLWSQSIGASASASVFPMNIQGSLFSSVQSLSHVRLLATSWTAARYSSLSITNSWSILKLMSVESVMPSNHLILSHAFLLLPSIFPSIRVFSNESTLCIR